MVKLVALKSFVGTVQEATESGSIVQFDHEVWYEKGDIIFTNLKGDQQVIPKSRFEEDLYMEVKEVKRVNKKYTYGDVVSGYKDYFSNIK